MNQTQTFYVLQQYMWSFDRWEDVPSPAAHPKTLTEAEAMLPELETRYRWTLFRVVRRDITMTVKDTILRST